MTTGGWIEDAKMASVAEIAARIGIQIRGQDGSRQTMECPACGATRRGSEDRRLPAGVRGRRWRCWACGVSGDVIDIVSYRIAGDRYTGQPEVSAWWRDVTGHVTVADVDDSPIVRQYPPMRDVDDILRAAIPAAESPVARSWLRSRLRSIAAVDRINMRVITGWPTMPRWARYRGRSWPELGYRLIWPVFDAAGQVGSVRVRRSAIGGLGPKSLPPAGYDSGGLVLADRWARMMLAGSHRPGQVIIAEGEPASCAWITARPEAAVIGITSGSWTEGHADRIPTGTTVIIATDHDPAGVRYADHIIATLRGRCEVNRWA